MSSKEPVDVLLEAVSAESKELGLHFKKIDRKRERQIILKEKEFHLQTLAETTQPALALHLVALILFIQVHKTAMLHAPGKFVPLILSHLRNLLDSSQPGAHLQLLVYQNLIIESLTQPDAAASLNAQLLENLPAIKSLVQTSSITGQDDVDQ